jgi:CBS domain containing-hemolysin-like protein
MRFHRPAKLKLERQHAFGMLNFAWILYPLLSVWALARDFLLPEKSS